MSDQVAPPDNETAGAGGPDDRHGTVHLADSDLEDRLRRALADCDNLRKRCERELVSERAAERQRVVAEWLPVVDNLDRAVRHASAGDEPLMLGVGAVRDQALATLARLGFLPLGEPGEPFDARRHEAVGVVEDDAPAGTVVDVVRPGYGGDEVVLRPAAVIVSRGHG